MVKVSILSGAIALAILLPIGAFAGDDCADFTKSIIYKQILDKSLEERYTTVPRILRDKLLGATCSDEDVIIMMKPLGWTLEERRNSVSNPDYLYSRSLTFCDRRRRINPFIKVRCRGRALVGFQDDKITFLDTYGAI